MKSHSQTGPFGLGREPYSEIHSAAPSDTGSAASLALSPLGSPSPSQRWRGGEQGESPDAGENFSGLDLGPGTDQGSRLGEVASSQLLQPSAGKVPRRGKDGMLSLNGCSRLFQFLFLLFGGPTRFPSPTDHCSQGSECLPSEK